MTGIESAAIIASVVSSVVAAAGAAYSAVSAANAREYQAEVAKTQGEQAQLAAEAEAEDRRRRSRYLLGEQLAAAGASGLQLEGSPLLAMIDSGVQEDLEARRILYRGYLESSGYRSQEALSRYEAASTRTSGYIQAGSSLLRGASNTYATYKGKGVA